MARATLRALAARQGTLDDPETDEEPGKIPHEYRTEAGAWFVQAGWPVRDGATPLLRHGRRDDLVPRLLHALGDAALTRELEPAWRAAGGWLAAALDPAAGSSATARAEHRAGLRSRAGATRSRPVADHPEGAGIVRLDGSEPAPPLADADTQAVAVAALDALARLDGGRRLGRARGGAAVGAASDWGPDVMALEHDGTPVPGAGSQLGWLLWARALSPDAAAAAAERLVAPDVLTPFGLRTLSTAHPAFRPLAYHRGGGLAVRLLARLGRAARGGPDGRGRARARRRSRCARPARPRAGALRGHGAGELEPVPVANRVQAWTVGARWAFEHEWDGRGPGAVGSVDSRKTSHSRASRRGA